ncbi:Cat, partial [Pantoea ananatis]
MVLTCGLNPECRSALSTKLCSGTWRVTVRPWLLNSALLLREKESDGT